MSMHHNLKEQTNKNTLKNQLIRKEDSSDDDSNEDISLNKVADEEAPAVRISLQEIELIDPTPIIKS